MNFRSIPALLMLLLLAGGGVFLFPTSVDAQEAGLKEQQTILQEKFEVEIEALAKWCADDPSLTEERRALENWIAEPPADVIRIPKLPQPGEVKNPPENATDAELEFHAKWWELREAYALELMELSQTALSQNALTLSIELAFEAARQDPGLEAARQALGEVSYQNEWISPFARSQYAARKTWDEKFGWVSSFEKRQLEAHKRPWRSGWMDESIVRKLRSDIEKGYKVQTAHFEVISNESLENAVQLAARLETYRKIWSLLFVSFHSSQRELELQFAGRHSPYRPFLHRVVYFSSREEYIQYLQGSGFGDVSQSTGFYMSDKRRSFFFAGEGSDRATQIHEASHQLFSETDPKIRSKGERRNFWTAKPHHFWILEGIACYLESYEEGEDFFTFGGFEHDRVRAARYHVVTQPGFYLPFEEMTSLNMQSFQTHPDVVKLYSQATGQTHFLMHYENGKYRPALMAYLKAIYEGREHRHLLVELTGTSYERLDQEYHEYLRQSLMR
ncbi:Hypothetical protein PBC10988_33460 [Planctomycetales bacterium 10988]|nr:Hypothetical protein PBC10988_33460 [Planctomycetales bacterium 10988]